MRKTNNTSTPTPTQCPSAHRKNSSRHAPLCVTGLHTRGKRQIDLIWIVERVGDERPVLRGDELQLLLLLLLQEELLLLLLAGVERGVGAGVAEQRELTGGVVGGAKA